MQTRSRAGTGDPKPYLKFLPSKRRTHDEVEAIRQQQADEKATKKSQTRANLQAIAQLESQMRQRSEEESDPSSFRMPVVPVMPQLPRRKNAGRGKSKSESFGPFVPNQFLNELTLRA